MKDSKEMGDKPKQPSNPATQQPQSVDERQKVIYEYLVKFELEQKNSVYQTKHALGFSEILRHIMDAPAMELFDIEDIIEKKAQLTKSQTHNPRPFLNNVTEQQLVTIANELAKLTNYKIKQNVILCVTQADELLSHEKKPLKPFL